MTSGTAAIVPVKSLTTAKSRLARELPPDERSSATLAMLRAVLDRLAEAPGIQAWAVVSADQDVLELAAARGGSGLAEPGTGLNPALEEGRRWAMSRGADSLLVLPGDVPFITAADIEHVLALLPERGVVIAPSKDLGTNALALRPPDAIPFRFGPKSSELHRLEAERAGLAVKVVQRGTLAFDVDEPSDYYHYRDMHSVQGRPAERG